MPTPAPHKQPHQTQWEIDIFKNCASFINGMAFKPSDWDKQGLEIIRIQNLTGNQNTINYYAKPYDKKYEVNYGDMLIAWSASLGVYIWKGEKAILNQHIFKVIFDKREINKDFFYFYVKLKINDMLKYTNGSTMKHITKVNFENIKIPLPPLPTQENIAQILSTLDKKIELNTRINAELESMAKLLYTRYFLEYNFPDSSGKPYKASGGAMVYHPTLKREIPQDWEVIKLANRFNFERGEEFGTASYKESKVNKHHIKFYRVGDMIDDSKCVYVDSSKENAPLISENDLLVSFDGSVGRVAYGLNGTYSSGIRKITDKHGEICQSGLYFIFTDSHIQHTINQHATGTNIKHAGSAIENLYMPYSKEVFSDFQNKINSMFALMRHTKAQSQQLAEWRDYLLPLLMGDQVEVV